jgi:hypothetical protein
MATHLTPEERQELESIKHCHQGDPCWRRFQELNRTKVLAAVQLALDKLKPLVDEKKADA